MLVAGRMHQLRRHMALLGHPVLGDARYTYGYASRHPDAPIQLTHAQAQQAMTKPFGFNCDHPYFTPDRAAIASHAFWASQRLGLASQQGGAIPVQPHLALQQQEATIQQADMVVAASPQESRSSEAVCTSSHISEQNAATAMSGSAPSSAKRELGATAMAVELDSMTRYAGRDPQQTPMQLTRPNRSAATQQVLPAVPEARGLDPGLTDLSLEAQSRLVAGAPHYAEALTQQEKTVIMHQDSIELPLELQRMLCLWAVRLMMPHPVTHEKMDFSVPDPPLFDQMRGAEADLAWKQRQKHSQ